MPPHPTGRLPPLWPFLWACGLPHGPPSPSPTFPSQGCHRAFLSAQLPLSPPAGPWVAPLSSFKACPREDLPGSCSARPASWGPLQHPVQRPNGLASGWVWFLMAAPCWACEHLGSARPVPASVESSTLQLGRQANGRRNLFASLC